MFDFSNHPGKKVVVVIVYFVFAAIIILLKKCGVIVDDSIFFLSASLIFAPIATGMIAAILLIPSNPIKLDRHCVIEDAKVVGSITDANNENEKNNNVVAFRYFIDLPLNEYLFQTSIRVRVVENDVNGEGTNKKKAEWDSETAISKERYKLDSARGSRVLVIDGNDGDNIVEAIKKVSGNTACNKSACIELIIQGNLSSGLTVRKRYLYYLKKSAEGEGHHECGVLRDCSFAPENIYSDWSYKVFLKHLDQSVTKENDEEIAGIKNYLNKKPLFCQKGNFNRYYRRKPFAVEGIEAASYEAPECKMVLWGERKRRHCISNYLYYRCHLKDKRIEYGKLVDFYKGLSEVYKF